MLVYATELRAPTKPCTDEMLMIDPSLYRTM